MKQIYLIIIFLFPIICHSQDSTFTFTKNGFTDFVVAKIDGKSQSDLYKKTLDWVSVTYKNPNEVIKAKIENEYIRIEGSNSNICCTKYLGMKTCNLASYQIEISFKEGKYKFDVIELKQYFERNQYSTFSGWANIELPTPKILEEKPTLIDTYFKSDGKPTQNNKLMAETIPNEFNSLNASLRDYLMNEKSPAGKLNDW